MKISAELMSRALVLTAVVYLVEILSMDALWSSYSDFGSLHLLALVVASCISVSLVSYHTKRVNQLTNGRNFENRYGLTQFKSFNTDMQLKDLMAQLGKELKNMRIVRKGKNQIILRTGASLTSWGEEITIEYHHNWRWKDRFEVVSRPLFSGQVLDFGKNINNILMIEKLINKR